MSLAPFTMHCLKAGTTVIGQPSEWDISPEVERIVEQGSGRATPFFRGVGKAAPAITFSTTAIKTALGLNGLSLTQITGSALFKAWLKKRLEYGTFESGSVHKTLTINKGAVIPGTIQAAVGQAASMAMKAVALFDDTNLPIVVGDNVALEALPTVKELYTVGPIEIEGVTMEGVVNVTIEPGIKEQTLCAAGSPFPEYLSVDDLIPTFSLQVLDLDLLTSANIIGQAMTQAAKVYLQKLDPDNPSTPLDEYIEFTMAAGDLYIENIGSSDKNKAPTLKLEARDDGTNSPVTIDTAFTFGA